ncbi:MAG: NAD(P)H-dependent oxidoreductase subunit E [Candidatus Krumholzibacteriota bacterium]|nr:NAD(P)H-dependent oxidoreductase subunit E [Candidatus Krumholzibacteriota bacterium]
MSSTLESAVKEICRACGNDRMRMMDIVRAVQEKFGCVDSQAMSLIAKEVSVHRVEVESVVSFYAFLSSQPKGKVVIRLCDDIIDEMKGGRKVAEALKDKLGIDFGETTADGRISLEHTPCIGMCDQAPAALINDEVVTYLSADSARDIIDKLQSHMDPKKLVSRLGDGNNAHDLVRSMVHNSIRKEGPVIFGTMAPGDGLRKALAMSPQEVIRDVKTSRLRGRGGAGFPTGMKWEFTRGAPGDDRFVICNADEGEPGTFKDRVILTERSDLMFEGMTIAGYAIGADTGIIYLRAEYAYLRAFLEHALAERRKAGLLGKNILGKHGFDFDIRIQMGAGAYICGEETALISSCEGLRGDPKNRPPFPAQKGIYAKPTVVNNVETFCCVARILEKGPGWFAEMGSEGSTGTKLLSIAGDCSKPGVYEVPFGITLREMLEMCGAKDTLAVQMGGASGVMVGKAQFDQTICYDDLATGGSVMVFDQSRDVLAVASKFMDFFIEESCGYCTPCRVGNPLLKERLDRIRAGKGEPGDLDYLQDLGETVTIASRCGLGQTSARPVLSTLANFRAIYERLVKPAVDGLQPAFDIHAALADSTEITGRESVHFQR